MGVITNYDRETHSLKFNRFSGGDKISAGDKEQIKINERKEKWAKLR